MTGFNSPRNARVRGFSLLELLVVVGIIGLTAAMLLPNIMGYLRGSRIRAGQDSVAGALQRARNLAIMKNSQMGVSFVIENNTTFWVHIEDTILGVNADAANVVGFTRQSINLAAPGPASTPSPVSTRYILPTEVEFAANAADCPGIPGFAPAQASLRFDRFGQSSLPGVTVGTTVTPGLLVVGGATAGRLYAPVPASGERSVCLIDRRTGLGRWLLISVGGRVVRSVL